MNKLSLLRPSAWFGARNANNNKWGYFYQPQLYQHATHRQSSWSSSRYRRSTHSYDRESSTALSHRAGQIPITRSASFTPDRNSNDLQPVSLSLISDETKPSESPPPPPASSSTETPPISPETTTLAAVSTTATPIAETTQMTIPTSSTPSEKVSPTKAPDSRVEFTNFNKAYAQIYSSMSDRWTPWDSLIWRPASQLSNVVDVDSTTWKPPRGIMIAAKRVTDMMQSVSGRIQPKQSALWPHLIKTTTIKSVTKQDLVA